MGGEETQEGPYYNSDTLDDGRIIAPGYVNCLNCTMYEHTHTHKKNPNKKMSQRNNNKKLFYIIKCAATVCIFINLLKNRILLKVS